MFSVRRNRMAQQMNWLTIITAIIAVETGGATQADLEAAIAREGAYGPMQIRQECLQDANEYCGTSYTLRDCRGRAVSVHVFLAYCRRYKADTYEKCAKLWVAGPNWRRKKGKPRERMLAYWAKVKEELEK